MIDFQIPSFLLPDDDIEALIFDLDGTLADTMPNHLTSWRMLGEYFGVPITDKMINDLAGTPTPEVALALNAQFGWSLDPVEVQKMKNSIYEKVKNAAGAIQPIKDVYELAKHYRGRLPLAIGTGSTRANAEAALHDMGVAAWFEVMVTAEDVSIGKPHPETFLRCAEAINIAPSKCLLYEDGPSGIDAGLRAGMKVINIETQEIFTP